MTNWKSKAERTLSQPFQLLLHRQKLADALRLVDLNAQKLADPRHGGVGNRAILAIASDLRREEFVGEVVEGDEGRLAETLREVAAVGRRGGFGAGNGDLLREEFVNGDGGRLAGALREVAVQKLAKALKEVAVQTLAEALREVAVQKLAEALREVAVQKLAEALRAVAGDRRRGCGGSGKWRMLGLVGSVGDGVSGEELVDEGVEGEGGRGDGGVGAAGLGDDEDGGAGAGEGGELRGLLEESLTPLGEAHHSVLIVLYHPH